MKKKTVNQRILKVISFSLAALIAMSSPMTALASDYADSNLDGGGDNGDDVTNQNANDGFENNSKSDANTDRNADTSINTDSNADTNANTNSNAASDANTDTNINTDSNANTDTNINTDSDANTDTNINTDGDTNTDADAGQDDTGAGTNDDSIQNPDTSTEDKVNEAIRTFEETQKAAEQAVEEVESAKEAAVGFLEQAIAGEISKEEAADKAKKIVNDAMKAVAAAKKSMNDIDAALKEAIAVHDETAQQRLEASIKEAKAKLEEAQYIVQCAKFYASYEEGSKYEKPAASSFVQLDAQSNPAYANEKEFDSSADKSQSHATGNFTIISDGKKVIPVSKEVYESYIHYAFSGNGVSNISDGTGSATGVLEGVGDNQQAELPLLLWGVENGRLTGECYTLGQDIPEGDYFVAYVFKKESDYAVAGYHFDGYMYHYEKKAVDSNDDNSTGDSSSANSSDNTSSDLTTPTVSSTDAATINDDIVPLASSTDLIMIDDDAVPLANNVDTITIDDDAIPLLDSVPQTGDSTLPVVPMAAAGVLALVAAYLMSLQRKEER